MKICWPKSISNDKLLEKCYQLSIANEIRRRKWSWIGYTLRKPFAEAWKAQGGRQRGRPKMSWKRSIDIEIKNAD